MHHDYSPFSAKHSLTALTETNERLIKPVQHLGYMFLLYCCLCGVINDNNVYYYSHVLRKLISNVSTDRQNNRRKTLAGFVVGCEKESLLTQTVVAACRVVTDLTAVSIVLSTLISV